MQEENEIKNAEGDVSNQVARVDQVEPEILEEAESAVSAESIAVQQEPQIVYRIPPNFVQNLLVKARAKIQERKRKKLNRIMSILTEKGKITSGDVQKLLRVSATSSTRYLDILEKENKIRQVGKTGKAVFYVKI